MKILIQTGLDITNSTRDFFCDVPSLYFFSFAVS